MERERKGGREGKREGEIERREQGEYIVGDERYGMWRQTDSDMEALCTRKQARVHMFYLLQSSGSL